MIVNLASTDYTWLVMSRENARKLASRLITRGHWFLHKEQENEHTIIVRSEHINQKFWWMARGLIFQVEEERA
jgi:hypothetical protein